MIPAGRYHSLIHGIKIEGVGRYYLHFTVLPAGERCKVRLFPSHITALRIATMHQSDLPQDLKGAQAILVIGLHPDYGNRFIKPLPIPNEKLIKVDSDVDLNRARQFCEFEDL